MKLVITGHTRGIGKCLYDKFTRHDHEVFGFSRSNGYDIQDAESRKQIIEQAKSADLFINNAYAPAGQTLLLQEMINQWDGTDKRIINLSSKLSMFPLGKEPDLDDYIREKQAQNQITQSRIFSASPQILNVIIGLVDTQMSSVFAGTKLSPENLAIFIFDLATQIKFNVQQVVIDVPMLDWKNIQRQ